MPNDGATSIGEWLQAAKGIAKLLEQVDRVAASTASDAIKYRLVFGMLIPQIEELCIKVDMQLTWQDGIGLGMDERIARFRQGTARIVEETRPILKAFGQS